MKPNNCWTFVNTDELKDLKTRVVNILANHDIHTKAELKREVLRGQAHCRKWRGCGEKTYRLLCEFVSVDYDSMMK